MAAPRFTKVTIGRLENDVPPAAMNTFHAVGDINGDGRPDIVVSGRNGRMVWFENTGDRGNWPVHPVEDVEAMECGGQIRDLTGDGLGDIINGNDFRGHQIFWWANPGPRGGAWQRRAIATTDLSQFHDTTVGRLAGEDADSLVFTNQVRGTNIYRVPLPADPTQAPWPNLQVIATARGEPFVKADGTDRIQPEEGLAIGDVDGDGVNEIVCGTHWYKLVGGRWCGHKFASGYITTKIAIADIDGDGRNEILLAEGDPCVYGKAQGGKLAWFKRGPDARAPWTEHVLLEGLHDAHSLQVGDLCGNGRPDILCGEVGVANRADDRYVRPPRLIVLENEGRGRFTPHVIDEGTGIHDAVLADMLGRGVLDIVGKPLHGDEKWHVHVYFNDTARP